MRKIGIKMKNSKIKSIVAGIILILISLGDVNNFILVCKTVFVVPPTITVMHLMIILCRLIPYIVLIICAFKGKAKTWCKVLCTVFYIIGVIVPLILNIISLVQYGKITWIFTRLLTNLLNIVIFCLVTFVLLPNERAVRKEEAL